MVLINNGNVATACFMGCGAHQDIGHKSGGRVTKMLPTRKPNSEKFIFGDHIARNVTAPFKNHAPTKLNFLIIIGEWASKELIRNI